VALERPQVGRERVQQRVQELLRRSKELGREALVQTPEDNSAQSQLEQTEPLAFFVVHGGFPMDAAPVQSRVASYTFPKTDISEAV
jgi:hypothetical protein